MGFKAMDNLTGGNALDLGVVDATVNQAPIKNCGLPSGRQTSSQTVASPLASAWEA